MPSRQPISYRDGIVVLGSCFADNIGCWLRQACLEVCHNPFGVLFNPASIASALTTLANTDQGACVKREHIFQAHDGFWYSYDFHSSHYGRTEEDFYSALSSHVKERQEKFARAKHFIITFGTAWVYEHEGYVVANCHKMPAKQFVRRMLSVEEIVRMWCPIIEHMCVGKHIFFSVSPIRHIKDTLHGNQVSKSTLLLAVDELCRLFPDRVEYIPAYEILNDDLRDYRFYADDLVHPSSLAVEIVKQYFAQNCLDKECREYLREVEPLVRASQHIPLHPESEAHKAFKCQNNLKIDQLIEKYHIFGLSILKV